MFKLLKDDEEITKVTKRNAEILACRLRICEQEEEMEPLREKLARLEAEHRREVLLASLEVDSLKTWQEVLTDNERHDKELVLKAVACGAFDRDNPWMDSYFDPFVIDPYVIEINGELKVDIRLPEEFLDDRDVVLAYVQREGVLKKMDNDDITFVVSDELRRDKEVMMEVCAKNGSALELADDPLKDDEEVVAVAHESRTYPHSDVFQFASDRLRGDKHFIVKLIKRTDIKQEPDNSFSANSPFMFLASKNNNLCFEDERDIASALLQKYVESKKHCNLNNFFFSYSEELDLFSHALYDDKETMMKFVQHNWENIQACSDRLRSCKDIVDVAMSQNRYAKKYALGMYKEQLMARQKSMNKASVLLSLKNKEMCFDWISDKLKNDVDIVKVALETGEVEFRDLSADLRQHKQLIFAAAGARKGGIDRDFFDLIPERWHGNEEFVLALLKGKDDFDYLYDLLHMFPALYHSKDVIIAITGLSRIDGDTLLKIIDDSPFHDDEEVMLAAVANKFVCLEIASERLLNDRNFVSNVIEKTKNPFILYHHLSDDFKRNNVDIVIQAIECYPEGNGDSRWMRNILDRDILRCVLDQRCVVMACIKTHQRNILMTLDYARDVATRFLDDEDIVRRALRVDPSELEYASMRLLNDRDFILSVAGICGRHIINAGKHDNEFIALNDDVLAAAIASDCGTFRTCFRPEHSLSFELLVGFASRIRSRLESYDSFYTILCGISCHHPPNVAPFWRCRLPLLDRGEETSTMFKRLIAEYAGVPLGTELYQLRKVSKNLLKFGF